jgi:hypothetical protein
MHGDQAFGITVFDASVYVVGEFRCASVYADAFIHKHDAQTGNVVWAERFSSDGRKRDIALDVAVDASGDIYVAGATYGTLPGQTSHKGYDAFVRKYQPDGQEVWTRQFGIRDGEFAYGIAAHGSDIYVAGRTGGKRKTEAFVRKYNAGGEELWTRGFGTSASGAAAGIAADASGIYITGTTSGAFADRANAGYRDVFVGRCDPDGNVLWLHQFGSSGDEKNVGVAASGGSVYVTGSAGDALPGQMSSGSGDAFLAKFSESVALNTHIADATRRPIGAK